MKGSGLWVNLGKTIAFQDHHDAFDFFKIPHKYGPGEFDAEILLGKALQNAGYDSVQCTCCHAQVYKFEIMFARHKQPKDNSPCTTLQTWGRDMGSCICDPKQRLINCHL